MYEHGHSVDSIEGFTGYNRRYIQAVVRRTKRYINNLK